ncbi:MAG TPA: hypothetical protein VF228_04470 [Iamia sp.]
MKTDHAADLAAELQRWQNFDECLLIGFRLVQGIYAAHLTFDYIWESEGQVRADLGRVRRPIELLLHGLESMELVGGLPDAQRRQPELLDWGITEVTLVTAEEGPAGSLRVDVWWPGERRLTFVANEAEVVEPDAPR